MQYKQVTIPVGNTEQSEIILAELSNIGYEGFEERDGVLIAFISSPVFDAASLEDVLIPFNTSCTLADVEEQNWNAIWEESFQPVVVPGFCTVRAHFHTMHVDTPYEIVITPQMSFGTGHHATTMLMMQQMQHIGLSGRSVLDFGTGTGILAILAEKLGAAKVLAIDNDEWAYKNVVENIARNNCRAITPQQGSLELAGAEQFDIILANINRNILLHYMADLHRHLQDGGTILMSGLLTEDFGTINAAAAKAGFILKTRSELNNWIVLSYTK
ncbi:MAG: 50S ribosomal protein L11 methyltransferase [Bacteroidetes bacterium]|nr:50S ribosomal protein L11 methyltransferase [Bacteroidota bacterium]